MATGWWCWESVQGWACIPTSYTTWSNQNKDWLGKCMGNWYHWTSVGCCLSKLLLILRRPQENDFNHRVQQAGTQNQIVSSSVFSIRFLYHLDQLFRGLLFPSNYQTSLCSGWRNFLVVSAKVMMLLCSGHGLMSWWVPSPLGFLMLGMDSIYGTNTA